MEWKRQRSGMTAEGENGIYFMILPKRNGRFFIKAYLAGGAERRLPFQDFEGEKEAMAWVEKYEAQQAALRAKYAAEEPIRF